MVVMLSTAYKEHALKRTIVFEWYLCFKSGDMPLENNQRQDRLFTSKTKENVEKMYALMYEDKRYSIDDIFELFNVS